MRRIYRSVIGGIVLPFLYFLLLWLVVGLVKAIDHEAHGDSWWFWVLSLPLEGGGRLYTLLYPAQTQRPFALLRPAAILSDLVGCFLLFATLTYLLLYIKDRKRTAE